MWHLLSFHSPFPGVSSQTHGQQLLVLEGESPCAVDRKDDEVTMVLLVKQTEVA